jgi:tRNA-guanine family transglycosylase
MDTVGGYDGTFDDEHVLLSAGVAYRNPGAGTFNLHAPENPASVMVDSGGFQAATRWTGVKAAERGLPGRFPYSAKELHDWAASDTVDADIVAGMDIACEDGRELYDPDAGLNFPGDYRDRMLESFEMQKHQRAVYETGDYDHDFMPVIQGNRLEDYEDFISLMQSEGLDSYDTLAIGTVCKRDDLDEILDVVELVRDYYPDKYLHLFGATLNIWRDQRFAGLFDSTDTAAWNWGASSKAEKKEFYEQYRAKTDAYGKALANQNRLQSAEQ